MQEFYKVLGVSENATDQEIQEAYNNLKKKYSEERFLEGEAGNQAAKNLTKLEVAFKEIMDNRTSDFGENKGCNFSSVEQLIRDGRYNEAQEQLDQIPCNSAEWHYIQSVIFYKKNWHNESKKQLEIAMNMDPNNSKYITAYTKLKNKMDYNERAFRSGNAYGSDGNPETQRQMGGTNDCFTFCATWCCMDMLCNICCNG